MTKEQLRLLQRNPPNFEERVDISTVKVDTTLPFPQRAEAYLAQIKNPYAFRSAGIAVNIEFSEDGKPLEEALRSYLTALKSRN